MYSINIDPVVLVTFEPNIMSKMQSACVPLGGYTSSTTAPYNYIHVYRSYFKWDHKCKRKKSPFCLSARARSFVEVSGTVVSFKPCTSNVLGQYVVTESTCRSYYTYDRNLMENTTR